MKKLILFFCCITLFFRCGKFAEKKQKKTVPKTIEITKKPFIWEGANMYFLLPDRFNNADTSNDINFERIKKTATLRGFEGGDLKGITQKIKDGYFTDLGINAIWMAPIFEQIHGAVNEGTGNTYGFHGYWTKDWTTLDANFGTKEDLKELVNEAHKKGIRILLDAVVNHTGPVTKHDSVWENWVRVEPKCTYKNYNTTIKCTLVDNLPDVLTDSDKPVELPQQLVEKWKKEGRYETEMQKLDNFFAQTNYPKAPRFYIMKWLSNYITEFGIDGYRVDTVKHVEENVWQEFRIICNFHYNAYKKANPKDYLDENFYLVGEVYGYGISTKKQYDFGDKKANYFDNAFNSLINFEFKWNAKEWPYEKLFSTYSEILHNELKGYGVLNYLSSHDDGQPFDKQRTKPFEAGTKLLLAPGTSQIYYGDETARKLEVEGAEGDANLRSNMNWEKLENEQTKTILTHYQKLGKFREHHVAIGAGIHKMISESPYVFQRIFSQENYTDKVVIGLDLPKGEKTISVGTIFENGTEIRDAYSDQKAIIKDGKVTFSSPFTILLLEK